MLKNILGQNYARTILESSLKNNMLSHSYLFFGPEGVGKKLAAYEFAKSLNCMNQEDDLCDGCISCYKIGKGVHPDVNLVKPDGEKIKIDQIKNIQRVISYRPYEGRKKVIIIDGAGKMVNEAANSFLKTLEEPPDNTVLILICVNPQSLLPTIISRCQSVRFNLLPYDIIKDIIKAQLQFSEEDAHIAAALSNGSAGSAVNLNIEKNKRLKKKALDILLNSSLHNIEYILHNAKEIAGLDKSDVYELLDYLLFFIRDIAVLKNGSSSTINKWTADELEKFNTVINISSMQKIFKVVMYIKNSIKKNANVQLALEVMMLRIAMATG